MSEYAPNSYARRVTGDTTEFWVTPASASGCFLFFAYVFLAGWSLFSLGITAGIYDSNGTGPAFLFFCAAGLVLWFLWSRVRLERSLRAPIVIHISPTEVRVTTPDGAPPRLRPDEGPWVVAIDDIANVFIVEPNPVEFSQPEGGLVGGGTGIAGVGASAAAVGANVAMGAGIGMVNAGKAIGAQNAKRAYAIVLRKRGVDRNWALAYGLTENIARDLLGEIVSVLRRR